MSTRATEMRLGGSVVVASVFCMAWLVPLLGRVFAGAAISFDDLKAQPHLPSVAAVPWDPRSDMVSSVPLLLVALLLASVSLFVVEFGKAALWRTGRVWVYALTVLFQISVAADCLRINAPDWFAFAAHWLFSIRPREGGAAFPIPSLVLLVVLAASCLRRPGSAFGSTGSGAKRGAQHS